MLGLQCSVRNRHQIFHYVEAGAFKAGYVHIRNDKFLHEHVLDLHLVRGDSHDP